MSGVREIIFDTETTGFHANDGDRITEIGCLEIIDLLPTGKQFHCYLDPQRAVPDKVVQITGLTTEFLKGKPLFEHKVDEFLEFIQDSTLIAHNAQFDMNFINAEMVRCGREPLPRSRFKDTMAMAHEQYPGSPASLDALCRRFKIPLTSRDKHGAITDSKLLSRVYLELNGGREMSLGLCDNLDVNETSVDFPRARQRQNKLPSSVTSEERELHRAFIKSFDCDRTVWDRIWNSRERRKI